MVCSRPPAPINNIVNEVVKKYENKQIDISLEKNLEINIRPNSIKRCLTNLIDNGLSYGKKVEILTKKTVSNTIILVDDINIQTFEGGPSLASLSETERDMAIEFQNWRLEYSILHPDLACIDIVIF